jgi:hypothetical protein
LDQINHLYLVSLEVPLDLIHHVVLQDQLLLVIQEYLEDLGIPFYLEVLVDRLNLVVLMVL